MKKMAFYRNYKDKDEILQRLGSYLDQAETDLGENQDLTQEAFGAGVLQIAREDPVNAYILKAGLFEESIKVHREFLMRVMPSSMV